MVNAKRKFIKDSAPVIAIFLILNFILYKLDYISINSLVLLTYASGFYSQLISFDIKDKKKWVYIILFLIIYVMVSILSK